MADNLKELKQLIDDKIGNFGVGSIKATDHNAILNEALSKIGKYTGFPYLITNPNDSENAPNLQAGECYIYQDFTSNEITGFRFNEKSIDNLNVFDVLVSGNLLKIKDYEGFAMMFLIDNIVDLGDGNIDIDVTIQNGQTPKNYLGNPQIALLETFEKGGSEPIFESDLVDGTLSSEDWGTIESGYDIANLKGRNLSAIIEEALYPTIQAYSTPATSNLIATIGEYTYEVGTSAVNIGIANNLTDGMVFNGNGSQVGNLRGAENNFRLYYKGVLNFEWNDVDLTIGVGTAIKTNAIEPIVTLGNNLVSSEMDFEAGIHSGNYTDNKGGTDLVPSLESAILDPLTLNSSFNLKGRYKHYHYLGNENTFSLDSATIRTYNSEFFSNTGGTGVIFNKLSIPSGNEDFVFYGLRGKTIVVRDETQNTDLAIAQTGDLQIRDAGGNLVDYTYYKVNFGDGGYPQDIEITLTIS